MRLWLIGKVLTSFSFGNYMASAWLHLLSSCIQFSFPTYLYSALPQAKAVSLLSKGNKIRSNIPIAHQGDSYIKEEHSTKPPFTSVWFIFLGSNSNKDTVSTRTRPSQMSHAALDGSREQRQCNLIFPLSSYRWSECDRKNTRNLQHLSRFMWAQDRTGVNKTGQG